MKDRGFFGLFVLLIAAAPMVASASGLVTGTPVQRIVARLGDASCLNIDQLAKALKEAAMTFPASGEPSEIGIGEKGHRAWQRRRRQHSLMAVPHHDEPKEGGHRRVLMGQLDQRAVILTKCDFKCLDLLMGPFLSAAANASGGDFTKHITIVAVGELAMEACAAAQAKGYRHQCVLDQHCHSDGDKGRDAKKEMIRYKSAEYQAATVQKVVWMQEALKLGYSVFFVDLDVFLRTNPLPWLVDTFRDADLAVSSEQCVPEAAFEGDRVRWRPGGYWNQNIGAYFMQPTKGALDLMQVWIAHAKEVMFSKAAITGQHALNRLFHNWKPEHPEMSGKLTTAPKITLKTTSGGSSGDGDIELERDAFAVNISALRAYRIGFGRFDTLCGGWCGCDQRAMKRREVLNTGSGDDFVCNMTQAEFGDILGFHFNCQNDYRVKVLAFWNWERGRIKAGV